MGVYLLRGNVHRTMGTLKSSPFENFTYPRLVLTDVSVQHMGSIFKGEAVLDNISVPSLRVRQFSSISWPLKMGTR